MPFTINYGRVLPLIGGPGHEPRHNVNGFLYNSIPFSAKLFESLQKCRTFIHSCWCRFIQSIGNVAYSVLISVLSSVHGGCFINSKRTHVTNRYTFNILMKYSFFALAFDTVHAHVVQAVVRCSALLSCETVKAMFFACIWLRRHIVLAFYLQILADNVAEDTWAHHQAFTNEPKIQ